MGILALPTKGIRPFGFAKKTLFFFFIFAAKRKRKRKRWGGREGVRMAVVAALRAGSLPRVRTLVDRGEDVNAADDDGRTPLHVAAMLGHPDIVRFLVGRGCQCRSRMR